MFCSSASSDSHPQVSVNFLPSFQRQPPSIDLLTVTIVAPTFLLGHMFGLGIFPMLNSALVEGLLSAVLVLAGEKIVCILHAF
jgi:hypothetical protein